jgi:hypothetical protein
MQHPAPPSALGPADTTFWVTQMQGSDLKRGFVKVPVSSEGHLRVNDH